MGALEAPLFFNMTCELCKLDVILKVYDDSDPRWIIMDCMTCLIPMIVWYDHTMAIPPKDWAEMELALRAVADKEFGAGNYNIDTTQNTVPDHLHWHARPTNWLPNAEWVEKIRKQYPIDR